MQREHLGPVGRSIERHAESAFSFLERLVSARSVLGNEAAAQEIVADELERLGLSVERLEVPDTIGEDPLSGIPQMSYSGRDDIVGRTADGPLAVLINGHIDVVPADPVAWGRDPFAPIRRDGWMYGRGAGDMKGGIAMATLALAGLRDAAPEVLDRPLGFITVIEEEATGNGTLASVRAGIDAEMVVLPESTDLRIMLGGVGIVWVDVALVHPGAHAERADREPGVLRAVTVLATELAQLGRRIALEVEDPLLDSVTEPYNVNVGLLRCGDWRSSVPSRASLGVRFGHPREWSSRQAIAAIEDVVAQVCDPVGVSATVTPTGYRAEGYHQAADSRLVQELAAAHRAVHGTPCDLYTLGSTTDARYYVNTAEVPAVCYGPLARDIHGIEERVELASIVGGARTLAHFLIQQAAGARAVESGAEPVGA